MSDVTHARDPLDAPVVVYAAAAADLAVIVAFVAIGRRTHHSGGESTGFFRVLWPFALGLVVAWAATGLRRDPLALRRAVPAALVAVAVGVVLRIVAQGHDFKVAFTIVATGFIVAGMLVWRVVASAVVRSRARRAFDRAQPDRS